MGSHGIRGVGQHNARRPPQGTPDIRLYAVGTRGGRGPLNSASAVADDLKLDLRYQRRGDDQEALLGVSTAIEEYSVMKMCRFHALTLHRGRASSEAIWVMFSGQWGQMNPLQVTTATGASLREWENWRGPHP